jgi:hypothetical protein
MKNKIMLFLGAVSFRVLYFLYPDRPTAWIRERCERWLLFRKFTAAYDRAWYEEHP